MIPPNKTSIDLTAGTATGLSLALGLYAFNAASNSKSTSSALFHAAIGCLACKYAVGLGAAWKASTKDTTEEQYFKDSITYANSIQRAAFKYVIPNTDSSNSINRNRKSDPETD